MIVQSNFCRSLVIHVSNTVFFFVFNNLYIDCDSIKCGDTQPSYRRQRSDLTQKDMHISSLSLLIWNCDKKNTITAATNTMWSCTHCYWWNAFGELMCDRVAAPLLAGFVFTRPSMFLLILFFITIFIANRSCYVKPVVQCIRRFCFTAKLLFAAIIFLWG